MRAVANVVLLAAIAMTGCAARDPGTLHAGELAERMTVNLVSAYCAPKWLLTCYVTLRAGLEKAAGELRTETFAASMDFVFVDFVDVLRGATPDKITGEALARVLQKSVRTMLPALGYGPRIAALPGSGAPRSAP
jgi:hypothetical protein